MRGELNFIWTYGVTRPAQAAHSSKQRALAVSRMRNGFIVGVTRPAYSSSVVVATITQLYIGEADVENSDDR